MESKLLTVLFRGKGGTKEPGYIFSRTVFNHIKS